MVDHGTGTTFEIGAGRVLTGLARRIRSEADARSVQTVEDVASFGDWLKARMEA
jgi:[acyl-carrier-protein] S-malonyltransferase